MTKTLRLNIVFSNLLALNFLSTFYTRMEHHHLWGVHYLEFTHEINYEAPDDFRWIYIIIYGFVKTKQRYEIHIYFIVFLCMHVVSWVLKHNTELTNYQATG